MIRIKVTEPKDASWKRWRKKCKKQTKDDLASVKAGKNLKIRDALYKEQQSFFVEVTGPFKGKCAYCETELHNHRGEIDHYRPKKGIQDLDGNWIKIGKNKKHPGYYWLAYDWTNFLPLCIGCNRIRAQYGKGNYFPLEEGLHAVKPSQVKGEKPSLLNPTLDNPDDNLKFNEQTWVVAGTNNRGRVTEKIIGLNERQLPRLRADAARDAEREIYDAFARNLGAFVRVEDFQQTLKSLREKLRPYMKVRNLVFDREVPKIRAALQRQLEMLREMEDARNGTESR